MPLEWFDYLNHFETVADWSGWSLDERATRLVMCFDGEAIKLNRQDVLSSEGVQETSERNEWGIYYDPTERAQAFKLEFRIRFRRQSESITQ